MSRAPSLRGPAAALAALLLGGCVYLNSLYNAERLFGEGERARLDGQDSVARVRYDSVVTKAVRGYREEPGGGWADDALYLLGRAHLRRGELDHARQALQRALDVSDDPDVVRGATLFLGAVATLEGDRSRALLLLNRALRDLEPGPLLAEGHLWRARANLSAGQVDAGWWDLDRAAEADPRLSATADLERVVWGIARNDTTRARRGVTRLLGDAPSHIRADTLEALLGAADRRWGPGGAAALLSGADESPWPPDPRDRLLLLRAELRLREGDTTAARADARRVADGFGAGAVPARLLLARLSLARARDVADLASVRPLLLPVSDAAPALAVLDAVRKIELLEEKADRPGGELALFAAAELARDELDAAALARTLFLDYARRADPAPWAGKALLAAFALSGPGEERREVRTRLRSMDANPYVRASRTGWFPAADFQRLEDELREGLRRVLGEVTAEADQLDVLLRQKGDTLR